MDRERSLLYSGSRDGSVCVWDLDIDWDALEHEGGSTLAKRTSNPFNAPTSFREQVQAHTHWINDIALADNGNALVTASSDTSVKIWRPHAEDPQFPQPLGLHSDYVKCLASPRNTSDWIASGGLDRKICLWDLREGRERLTIDVASDEKSEKGSVYALGVGGSVIGSGGPESIVKLWDSRTGKRVMTFVGHTDNIRDILISESGDTIMSASSDQTVKVWSMAAGRCVHTLTMHSDSVWSLYSDHPRLAVFYSSDRSGLVAKTDVRGCSDMDDGISIALCREHGGVSKVVNAGNHIWTATQSSSINRWLDVNTEGGVQLPESVKVHRFSVASRTSRHPSSTYQSDHFAPNNPSKRKIPLKHVLRISNTAPVLLAPSRDPDSTTLHSAASRKKPEASEADLTVSPVRTSPEESVEGQNGLIKHVMLNDRRRVLTLDTAGEVVMWDILKVSRGLVKLETYLTIGSVCLSKTMVNVPWMIWSKKTPLRILYPIGVRSTLGRAA